MYQYWCCQCYGGISTYCKCWIITYQKLQVLHNYPPEVNVLQFCIITYQKPTYYKCCIITYQNLRIASFASLPTRSLRTASVASLPTRSLRITIVASLPTRSLRIASVASLPTRSLCIANVASLPTRSLRITNVASLPTRSLHIWFSQNDLRFFNPQYRTPWSVEFAFFLSLSLISSICIKKLWCGCANG